MAQVRSQTENSKKTGRRTFMASTGVVAAGAVLLGSPAARAADANGKIRIGLIGCGGRGGWIFNLFEKHGGYTLAACADYFEEKAQSCAHRFKIDPSKAYSGLKGYQRLLDNKDIDAVAIESPPFFHPEQAAAAVAAGKHVYCAKPVSVDVPGCASIADSGKKATEKKLVFLVDFQTRANPLYQEAIKRVQAGDIGKIVAGEAVYYCGPLGNGAFDQNNAEQRIKNWSSDRILSGDVITEQNIHSLDVMTWIMDDHPVEAAGKCFKKARGEAVTCNSVWSILFMYPDDVMWTFASKQCGSGYDDIGDRAFGARGTLDAHYFGSIAIKGSTPYKGGTMVNLYAEGATSNIATFHESVTKGTFDNPTVAPSVRSNLTTILGRTACYKKQPLTWDEMMKANEKYDFDTKGCKD